MADVDCPDEDADYGYNLTGKRIQCTAVSTNKNFAASVYNNAGKQLARN